MCAVRLGPACERRLERTEVILIKHDGFCPTPESNPPDRGVHGLSKSNDCVTLWIELMLKTTVSPTSSA